jgi:3-oxoacyl-[acyl-carrier-protein] synthase II
MTGHLLGAAGAIESIASVLTVQNNIIPPTINHFTDDPEIDNRLKFNFNKTNKTVVNSGLSNTFGFGGHNVSIIFKKFSE